MKKWPGLMSLGLAAGLCATAGRAGDAPNGAFIQLNRELAKRSAAEWKTCVTRMRDAGIRTIYVQWSAENGLAYFRADPPYPEQYEAIENILRAARQARCFVYLGLEQDTDYWNQIKARPEVIRDYLLVRTARNEAVQRALLRRFRRHPAWIGYYVPDEIDDLTWRQPGMAALMSGYVRTLTERLRTVDPKRTIAISAFVRGRTAPDFAAANLLALVRDSRLHEVLIQDGMGVGDPKERYVPDYLGAIRSGWTNTPIRLGCVVEAFRQTSKPDEPFQAVPAPVDRMARQLGYAAPLFDNVVLFSFPDYIEPERGPAAAALYEYLVGLARERKPAPPGR